MPSRVRQYETWESIVDGLSLDPCKHTLRKISKSPYIYARSKDKTFQISLKPLQKDYMEDVRTAAHICRFFGEGDWRSDLKIEELIKLSEDWQGEYNEKIYTWEEVINTTKNYLKQVMKNSSMHNHNSAMSVLLKDNPPFKFIELKKWLAKKDVGSAMYYNRLNTLEAIRKALVEDNYGDEPSWLRKQDLAPLRELHHEAKKRKKRYDRNSDMTDIRGIPTKEEAEKHLDSLALEFPLEQWCLAMLLCFGLRPHELWHIKPEDNKGQMWVYIPGQWRTKSKAEHWSWCLYPDWVKKFLLKERFKDCQSALHFKSKPLIVSAKNRENIWNPDNSDNDMGVCINNTKLGHWLNQRNRRQLPDWYASVPDVNGENSSKAPKKVITAYDLRHTWAVRVATDNEWEHISDEQAAMAMGHSLEIHRSHYKRWVGSELKKKKFFDSVQITIK